MMSLNYSAEEFLKIMMTLNFEKFEDGCDLIGPIRLIRHFGWFKGNAGDERRSVFINDLGVKFTDFELSEQTKRALIDQGRIATAEYLDKPQQPLPEIKRLLRRA